MYEQSKGHDIVAACGGDVRLYGVCGCRSPGAGGGCDVCRAGAGIVRNGEHGGIFNIRQH